jgi:hypothetical protein
LYLNSSELKAVENSINSMGRDLDKLTKNNSWLCWKALKEWDIQDGETYLVMCAATEYSQDCIVIIATIKNGGQSFNWRGKSISSQDLERLRE